MLQTERSSSAPLNRNRPSRPEGPSPCGPHIEVERPRLTHGRAGARPYETKNRSDLGKANSERHIPLLSMRGNQIYPIAGGRGC